MRKYPPPIPLSGRSRWGPVLFFICLAMFAAWLVLLPSIPGAVKPAMPLGSGWPCALHTVTGLPCALCGGTRAVRSLSKGNLQEALYFNSLAVVLTGLAVLIALLVTAEALAARHLVRRPKSSSRWILIAVGFSLLVPWNIWHASSALRTPKPELVNFSHPLVQWIRNWRESTH